MSIELEGLSKRYGHTAVVDGVSLAIASGELFVLLGPSGSGKSTLLRMIAGLVEVDAGKVCLHGREVTHVSAREREIGFVFQHYALFRHMSVADNVEFALEVRRLPARQRRERREELLQLVGLSGFAKRYPRQLSGGQQQRVALARALAHEPRVLLLDEPFGALDARIRLDLRQALRRIQRDLGLTAVFVTHDQEEAFELADRLAVLHQGRLLEVGAPRELYLRPRSPFVATFLGAANLLVGEATAQAVRLGPVTLPLPGELLPGAPGQPPRRVQVVFRPEDVTLTPTLEGSQEGVEQKVCLGRGVVEEQAFVGSVERLRLRLEPLAGVRAVAPLPPFGGRQLLVDALRPQHEAESRPLAVGDEALVGVRRFHVLAPARLRLLIDSGNLPASRAARALGESLSARLATHVESLTGEPPPGWEDGGDDDLGAETESGAEGFDIAVLGLDPDRFASRQQPFAAGFAQARHHLLLVPGPAALPANLLVAVAVGEPGKADVRFAERLAWQLGATATVLTVCEGDAESVPPHVRRFLDACLQMLGARGVVARSRLRHGRALAEIRAQIDEGGHDLLVVGAPLRPDGEKAEPLHDGLLGGLLRRPPACPILVVRRQVHA